MPLLFPAPAVVANNTNAPAWPPPPAEPYVVYVASIAQPADIGVQPTPLRRFANWLSGAGPSSAELRTPFGLALDDAGNLLVTDPGAGAVCCLDRTRKKWRRWEKVGNTRFQCPVAIARQGRTFFVADSALGKVIAFEESGKVQFEITRDLERPAGLALLEGKLFIADSQRHEIVVCDLRGRFVFKFGRRGSGSGEFNYPSHVATDPAGRIYVTDSLNYRVQVFDAAGRFQRVIGSVGDGPGHFSRPKGVAADRSGHLYVVDALFDNVQVFDDQGRLLLNWGESGSSPGQFWLPNGIAISRDNDIYVADSYNRRIQVFKYTGKQ
jgi:DNA-binding beta-propeller fold protein YncE